MKTQSDFIYSDTLETLLHFDRCTFGAGKTTAIILAALLRVDDPEYVGVIFKHSYADLAITGGIRDQLLDIAHQEGLGATFDPRSNRALFPSGAKIYFGYCGSIDDAYRYSGMILNFLAFDELQNFDQKSYEFLFSRLRSIGNKKLQSMSTASEITPWIKHRFFSRSVVTHSFKNEHLKEEEKTCTAWHCNNSSRFTDNGVDKNKNPQPYVSLLDISVHNPNEEAKKAIADLLKSLKIVESKGKDE